MPFANGKQFYEIIIYDIVLLLYSILLCSIPLCSTYISLNFADLLYIELKALPLLSTRLQINGSIILQAKKYTGEILLLCSIFLQISVDLRGSMELSSVYSTFYPYPI